MLAGAKVAFASRGYSATSVSHIVERTGVARGTFYQYFDNKLHVLQTILDAFLDDLGRCVKPIAVGRGAPAPEIQIRDNLTRVLSLVLREKELTQILIRHTATVDDSVEQRVGDFYRQIAEMIERSLTLGIAMRLVRPCDTRLTAYAIIGAVKEVIFQITSSREPTPSVEKLAQELLDFGFAGILAGSRSSLPEVIRSSTER